MNFKREDRREDHHPKKKKTPLTTKHAEISIPTRQARRMPGEEHCTERQKNALLKERVTSWLIPFLLVSGSRFPLRAYQPLPSKESFPHTLLSVNSAYLKYASSAAEKHQQKCGIFSLPIHLHLHPQELKPPTQREEST